MKLIVAGALLVLTLAPGAASAQAVDCAKAANAVQKAICADKELLALDRSMAAKYAAAIKDATPAKKTELEAQQRRWAIARDACGRNTDVKACVTKYYETRTAALDTMAAASKPHTFACSDKSSVIVQFVNEPKPHAIVTHGTSKWTLPQVAAASGARYGNDNVSVWNKGTEITFDVGGKPMTCVEKQS
jgi:uncharacterized protein